ncbi:hypothetical protein OKW21_003106 [Catalinimonas alkaloidigena]|uniref:carbohydrate binding family 9 domain-containing protein n=1 Tax=Catalinimonas alkaloidigena TaxID=1075417 RepID=UPI002405120F|nr:DUF5916 domain-containing protein [Catalinimonas alkaloidigena]MDF9797843.1 hypothetical protein [Catalinimonas alkaloidigena]
MLHYSRSILLKLFFSGCVFFLLHCAEANAQNAQNFLPTEQASEIRAVKAADDIQVDGRLDEPSWQKAPVTEEFFRMEPRQRGSYQYTSRVKVLYDEKNLYFGIYARDSLGRKGVRVQDFRRDFIYGENDVMYIQLDPQNLKRYCVSFQTTPLGTQRDLQVFDDNFKDNDWDALWRVRTIVVDSGYYAEFAIPFKSLRYERLATGDSVSWGITLARMARRDYETTVFPAIPQAYSPYRMTYAAQLKGLELPEPSVNLRTQPYALYQYERLTDEKGQMTTNQNFKAGGEIKWAVNPHAVLDLTFNTDFAQADVDRAVNNLTRFNVFFPEKRQFFLENSGVYAGANVSAIKPFFSRTIGLANAQFNADPVPIDAGARFTDRTEERTLAGLYVHQRSTENQGAANFGVLRYAKNYGRQNNIGLMLTHRLDAAKPNIGFAQQNNTTLTIDGLMRPKDEITIQYLASASRDNSPDNIGFAASLFAGYFPNNMYLGWLTNVVSEKYLPGMGFIFQNDVIQHNPGGYYIIRPKGEKWRWIRRWDPGFFLDMYQSASDGTFQSAQIDIFPIWFIFQDGGKFTGSILPTWDHFFFRPLGIAVTPDEYYYTRYQLSYRSDASKKISGSISYQWGDYYDGQLQEVEMGIRIAPIPHIAFAAEYSYKGIQKLGEQQTTTDLHLLTSELRLAYNPRIRASAFYQYNTATEQGRWNIRGSWEFAPLSFLYVVFNENSFLDTSIRNQSLISKLTYLKQF